MKATHKLIPATAEDFFKLSRFTDVKLEPIPWLRIVRAINEFEVAVREHEMLGSREPAEQELIEISYRNAKEHLHKVLFLLPPSFRDSKR